MLHVQDKNFRRCHVLGIDYVTQIIYGIRRYPEVRLDHLPCRSSAYVSPVRAQWGADYFGLRPIDFIHRQSGRR